LCIGCEQLHSSNQIITGNLAYVVRILIVEDHARVRASLRALLTQTIPCEIYEAENGRVGLEAAQVLSPDLILLDLSMPVMNGLEAARAIHRLLPAVPLLLWSAVAEAVTAEESRTAGFSAVASKTESAQKLVEQVRTLLVA
jgi:DNA-binding NarL/FixJ family response regulator